MLQMMKDKRSLVDNKLGNIEVFLMLNVASQTCLRTISLLISLDDWLSKVSRLRSDDEDEYHCDAAKHEDIYY